MELALKMYASRNWCHVHAHQFWWAWSFRFWRYGYLSKTANFPFFTMDYNSPWSSKNLIDRNQLKNLCILRLMWNACKPILVGVTSPVSEILLILFAFKMAKISFQKLELVEKIHACRGWCEIHENQFWWAWPLWFWRFCSFFVCLQNGQNFPLDHGL